MEKKLRNKIKDILPEGSSKELIDSVHKFVQGREKMAFMSARMSFTFGPMRFQQASIAYHYKDVEQYLNTPE